MDNLIQRLKRQKQENVLREQQNQETAKIYADYVKTFNDTEQESSGFYAAANKQTLSDANDPNVQQLSKEYLSQLQGRQNATSQLKKTRELDALSRELSQKHAALNAALQSLHGSNQSKSVETSVLVHNLPSGTTSDHLVQEFGQYGPLNVTLQNAATATVTFCSSVQAAKAREFFGDSVSVLATSCPLQWGLESCIINGEARVQVPFNELRRRVIDLMAQYTAKGDYVFEEYIKLVEKGSALFDFVVNQNHPDHLYYRYMVYTVIQARKGVFEPNSKPGEPFYICKNGIKYYPPQERPQSVPIASPIVPGMVYNNGDKPLRAEELTQVTNVLANVTNLRKSVADAMVFIIQHSESAYPITSALVESLEKVTTVDGKLARLYLTSDVLHNSCANQQYAWTFRNSLEKAIPRIFEDIRKFKDGLVSKLAAQQLVNKALYIIATWENWQVFSKEYTRGLEYSLLGECIDGAQYECDGTHDMAHAKENAHLIDESVDGSRLDYREMYLRFPLEWRKLVHKYLYTSLGKLRMLCQQRGMATFNYEREQLVLKLMFYEIYWSCKSTKLECEENKDSGDDMEKEDSDMSQD